MQSKYPRKPSHLFNLYFLRQMGVSLLLGFSLALPHVTAAQTGDIKFSKPYVLSSTDSELIIDIPITLPSSTDGRSVVSLASPQAHTQKGLHYPAWLSDAGFQLRQGHLQRPSLRITPQRGNPEAATDLLLEFVLQGKRYWQPYHLLLEQQSSFEGTPIPAIPFALDASSALPANESPSTAPPPRASSPLSLQVQTQTPNKAPAKTRHQIALRGKQPAAHAESAAAVPTPLPTPVPPTAPIAPPEPPASATTAATVPTPDLQAKPPALQPKREVAFWQQLEGWQIPLIASLLLLCAAYLAYRLWQARRAKLAGNAPLLNRQTEFQPSGSAQFANTVFGLDDSKANDMHQQWFDQKTKQTPQT